jgi:hypothetical protein
MIMNLVFLVSYFSENYFFIIQDSLQGYYWANDQTTILPFIAKIERPDGSILHLSIAVESYNFTHGTISVQHTYLRPVFQHLMILNNLSLNSPIQILYRRVQRTIQKLKEIL